ncbi:hypothetical protein RHSIM_Rhsim05G0167400 [Rhododendron simsii]|uniref:Uncharacterized protein n=1 Tax=Rhododendron simsii TaxID=118357 RepID=A0A834GZZ2_RHOSS|nr:hypothetical protein RHSIM_Rhsim05G0167400 [Rhododendron simsii]
MFQRSDRKEFAGVEHCDYDAWQMFQVHNSGYQMDRHLVAVLFVYAKGELPPGRTAARSTSSAFPFQDTEIERELNELRRKAQDF